MRLAKTLCPGYVRTPLVERQIDDQARAHGGGSVTGAALPVDGGWTAH